MGENPLVFSLILNKRRGFFSRCHYNRSEKCFVWANNMHTTCIILTKSHTLSKQFCQSVSWNVRVLLQLFVLVQQRKKYRFFWTIFNHPAREKISGTPNHISKKYITWGHVNVSITKIYKIKENEKDISAVYVLLYTPHNMIIAYKLTK